MAAADAPTKAQLAAQARSWHPELYGQKPMSDDEVLTDYRRRVPTFTNTTGSPEAKEGLRKADVDWSLDQAGYKGTDYSTLGRKAGTFSKSFVDSALAGIPEMGAQYFGTSLYSPEELEESGWTKAAGDLGGTLVGFGKIGKGIKAAKWVGKGLKAANLVKDAAIAPEAVALIRAIEAPTRGAIQGASQELTRQMHDRSTNATNTLPGATGGVAANALAGALFGLPELMQGAHIAKDIAPKFAAAMRATEVPTSRAALWGLKAGVPAVGTFGAVAGSNFANDPETWWDQTKADAKNPGNWVLPAGFGYLGARGLKHGWELPPERPGVLGNIFENFIKPKFQRNRPATAAGAAAVAGGIPQMPPPNVGATTAHPSPATITPEVLATLKGVADNENTQKLQELQTILGGVKKMRGQIRDKAPSNKGVYGVGTLTIGDQKMTDVPIINVSPNAEGMHMVEIPTPDGTGKKLVSVPTHLLSEVRTAADMGAGRAAVTGQFEGGTIPDKIRVRHPIDIPGLGTISHYDKGPTGPPRLWITDADGLTRAADMDAKTGQFSINGKLLPKNIQGTLAKEAENFELKLAKPGMEKRQAAMELAASHPVRDVASQEALSASIMQELADHQAELDALVAKVKGTPYREGPKSKMPPPRPGAEPAGGAAGYSEADFERTQAAHPGASAQTVEELLTNAGIDPSVMRPSGAPKRKP